MDQEFVTEEISEYLADNHILIRGQNGGNYPDHPWKVIFEFFDTHKQKV